MTDRDDDKQLPVARGRAEQHDDDDDDDGDPVPPDYQIGEPFALAYDCELRNDPPHEPAIVVQCTCGKPFKMLLLEGGYKPCPHCNKEYTHMLLVCQADNRDAFAGVCEQIADANPDPEQGDYDGRDRDDDDDDDGDQGDDGGDDGD